MLQGLEKSEYIKELENKGVVILSAETLYIDKEVVIEGGVTIYPNNHIYGKTVIKKGAVIEPNNVIYDSVIGENTTVLSSTLKQATVGSDTTVGPNAYLRPNANIGNGCRIGDFVEIKNSKIGNGSKVSHLTYIGDADVGENCNFGCGVIFANYDGKNKYRTVVGNHCFIGSNCNLVAPVVIDDESFIAAGTTVTKDVKKGAFIIGRVRQEENEKLAEKYNGGRK